MHYIVVHFILFPDSSSPTDYEPLHVLAASGGTGPSPYQPQTHPINISLRTPPIPSHYLFLR
jgi:hypothetical protein